MKNYRKGGYVAWLTVISVFLLATNAIAIDPMDRQKRPIEYLGVSGGNINDGCSAGTLGSLVENKRGKQFILSNNHVLASENEAEKGDLIIQPGSLDDGCRFRRTNRVARLRKFIPIRFSGNNLVDAAMAKAISSKVDPGGSILGIGQISRTPINPSVGMRVKKAGRTTGLTSGQIDSVGVTVDVRYASGRIARFVDQIIVFPGGFSSPGDSGSLIIKNTSTCPQPVGLLFAGSSRYTVANPIKTVYKKLRVTPVGCTASSTEASPMSEPLFLDETLVARVNEVKARHEDDLLKMPGVLGVGIGEQDGEVVIKVFVKKDSQSAIASGALPHRVDGFKLITEFTEEFIAY